MQRISTNATLFLKIFVPVFWIVFFGASTLAIWFSGDKLFGEASGVGLRWGSLAFYVIGLLLFVFTLLRLKRVEVDNNYLVVTNYFKTVRYPWQDVEKITENDLVVLTLVHIYLKAPGRFGRRITFLASQKLYADAKDELRAAGVPVFQ